MSRSGNRRHHIRQPITPSSMKYLKIKTFNYCRESVHKTFTLRTLKDTDVIRDVNHPSHIFVITSNISICNFLLVFMNHKSPCLSSNLFVFRVTMRTFKGKQNYGALESVSTHTRVCLEWTERDELSTSMFFFL